MTPMQSIEEFNRLKNLQAELLLIKKKLGIGISAENGDRL